MFGAIGSHLFTDLGVAVTLPGQEGDYSLFIMAVIALTAGMLVTWMRRHDLPNYRKIHVPKL